MLLRGLLILMACFMPTAASAWYNSVGAEGRFYPIAFDFPALVQREALMWDQRKQENPGNYGIWKLQALGSLLGRAEVTALVYPISFLKIYAGVGGSYRWWNNPVFNCSLNICGGFLQRTRLGTSFILNLGYHNSWEIIPDYMIEQVSISGSTPIADEIEAIKASSGGDTFDAASLRVGHIYKKQVYSLYGRQAVYRSSGQRNSLIAVQIENKWKKTNLIVGVGYYASDLTAGGLTSYGSFVWHWGRTLSPF